MVPLSSSSMGFALPEHPRMLRCIPLFFEMVCVNNLAQIAIILVGLVHDILELDLLLFFFFLAVSAHFWCLVTFECHIMCKCFNTHRYVILLALLSW
jgi:hypothetical protein